MPQNFYEISTGIMTAATRQQRHVYFMLIYHKESFFTS